MSRLPSSLLVRLLAGGTARASEKERKPEGVITLERAYDLALATDQSIRIAYWEVRKANLLPWSALARLGPGVNGSVNLNRGESTRNGAGVRKTTRTNLDSSGGLVVEQPLIDLTVFPAFRRGTLSA